MSAVRISVEGVLD